MSVGGIERLDPALEGKQLRALIAGGSVEALREYFDQAFFASRKTAPDSEHLKLAIVKENMPIMRLLILRGAGLTARDLYDLEQTRGNKYPQDIKNLKSCGFKFTAEHASAPVADISKKPQAVSGFEMSNNKKSLSNSFNKAAIKVKDDDDYLRKKYPHVSVTRVMLR